MYEPFRFYSDGYGVSSYILHGIKQGWLDNSTIQNVGERYRATSGCLDYYPAGSLQDMKHPKLTSVNSPADKKHRSSRHGFYDFMRDYEFNKKKGA